MVAKGKIDVGTGTQLSAYALLTGTSKGGEGTNGGGRDHGQLGGKRAAITLDCSETQY